MTPEAQLNRLLDEKLAGLPVDDLTRRLLWLAKSGGMEQVVESYDEAWDVWDRMRGRGDRARGDSSYLPEYIPTDEVAQWMREHWDELVVEMDQQPWPNGWTETIRSPVNTYCDAPVSNAASPALGPVSAAVLLRKSVIDHFEHCTRITMKDGVSRRPQINVTQAMLFATYHALQALGVPIKIIVLKARQLGASEGSAQLCYHHSRANNLAGFMMADTAPRTDKIWELFKRHLDDDTFEKHWGNKLVIDSEKARLKFRNKEGKVQEVEWNRGTAGDTGAGSAGTRQILWMSESGRYAKDGVFKDSTVIGNALNSVPDSPLALVIAESTAEGSRNCWHGTTFDGAVTLDERLNGKIGNGWVKVFIGWHQADDYQLDSSRPENAEFFNDQDERWAAWREEEQAGIIRHGWTAAQLAWRRKKIIGDLSGDLATFRRDYPSTADEAWESAGAKRFHQVRVAEMMVNAEALWKRTMAGLPGGPVLGVLQDGGAASQPNFFPGLSTPWLWVAEPPRVGLRYSLTVDPMTMEQARGSDDPDNHACGILRHEYVDAAGEMQQCRLAAAIYEPGGCKWESYTIAERLRTLARWYGDCITVQEANKAMDLLLLQKQKGSKLWQRDVNPTRDNPSTRQKIDGWLTTEATRRIWVSAAAEAIQERQILCEFLPAIRELDTFIIRKGRAEASSGCHDDWVAMLGIGLATRGACTKIAPMVVRSPVLFTGGVAPSQQRLGSLGAGAIG